MSSSMLINSKISNNSLKIIHSKKVRMISARSNKSSSGSCVGKLVISLEHQRGSEERLFCIFDCTFNVSSGISEVFLGSFGELLSINVTSSCNNNIFSNIEFVMELSDLFSSDRIYIVSNTSRWLA